MLPSTAHVWGRNAAGVGSRVLRGTGVRVVPPGESDIDADESPHGSTNRGLVVFAAGTSWDDIRMPDQHMAERLASYSPVLYVDPAISLLTPMRNPNLRGAVNQPRLRVVAPGLFRLTPVVPPGISRPGLRDVATRLRRHAIQRAVRQMGRPVRAVVTASLDDVFGTCREDLRVLYATDDFTAGSGLVGVSSRYLSRCEQSISRRANLIVTCSPVLTGKWSRLGHEPIYIPNGVDDVLFAGTDNAPLPPDVQLDRPIAGFVGHLSDRIDLSVLEAVAASGVSLLLVGPRQRTFAIDRMERLLLRDNVHWVGPKEFRCLPSYMRVIDVGLLPYRDSDFNRSSFPLKTLEYLAAGRPAVATDLPAIRWLDTNLIAVASSPRAFAEAVLAELDRRADPTFPARRKAFARQHSWDARAASFAHAIGLLRGTEITGASGTSSPRDDAACTS